MVTSTTDEESAASTTSLLAAAKVHTNISQYYVIGDYLYFDERRVHIFSKRTKQCNTYFFTENESVFIAATNTERHPLAIILSKLCVEMDTLVGMHIAKKKPIEMLECDICNVMSYATPHCVIWRCCGDIFHIGDESDALTNSINLYLCLCSDCKNEGEQMINTWRKMDSCTIQDYTAVAKKNHCTHEQQ